MLLKSGPITPHAQIILTDSRFLSDPSNSIFVAIKGERHDGHNFIQDLYEKGIREFIIEKNSFETNEPLKAFLESTDAEIWVVQNAIKALQNLAATKRKQHKYPVVGITGSNGKTIVKEWLSFLLEPYFEIIKSPRSYNSQIGVALSVWEMSKKHNLGIFEAGISMQNEMQNLEEIIKPEIGIFTNIGSAHNEGFRSLKQKITEKLRLFKKSKVLVFCKDYQEISEELSIFLMAVNPKIKLLGWSSTAVGPNCVETIQNSFGTSVTLYYSGESFAFDLPFNDHASVENAIHCAYTALYMHFEGHLEIDIPEFLERFKQLKPVAMRLELKQGSNNNYVIDDTYNNDLGGLKMALNFMSQHQTRRDKTLIISDILQTGIPEKELYKNLADLLKSQHLNRLIAVGTTISKHKKLFDKISTQPAQFYTSTDDFLNLFDFESLQSNLILVKGARPFAFERIVNKLVMKVHGTVFEVNLDALTHNLNFYRNKIGSSTKIMVMVKAFAYGSGSTEVASWLQYHRVDYLAVAYTDEGVSLRQNGIKLPIMVLNAEPETFHKLFEYDLEPEIYSIKLLQAFLKFKQNAFPKTKKTIHLKIDTGMHRLGFIEQDLTELQGLLNQDLDLKVGSIFSHLVGADEAEHVSFSKSQIQKFTELSDRIIANLGYQPLRHICNSAGIIRYPEAKFDMVRLGIGLYGVESSGMEQNALEVVGTLKTTISQIKTLSAGDTVGYGRRGVIEKETKIATIAIGYADGFDRGFSRGAGKVMVNGVLCPVVGNVCMDMTMVDVTEAKCQEGDQVVIFGKSPTIFELSETIETIPYEILTSVSERVKRVFYHE
ncbi:bifunctional UDP-N-acetylmuramoyl-tripeptide:D-alanyl-D-alanine ligase/alanine racemase [Lacihabitans lacunae]|uniref:Alanine racemase n=1 Tax=Lacihabitans lacunae TaxID=1028214 RepID=A0ABV7YVA3_9BACT